jgi:hypothetical protein
MVKDHPAAATKNSIGPVQNSSLHKEILRKYFHTRLALVFVQRSYSYTKELYIHGGYELPYRQGSHYEPIFLNQ